MADGALAGCRVLDLTDEKGMLCGKLLADMGAAVTRVERPGAESDVATPLYCRLNAGKRRLTLDLEDSAVRARFIEMVKTADVLVESAAPGYMAGLGLDYAALSKINPRLVMASITGFGQTGPYRDFKYSDIVAAALGGQMFVNGEPGGAPLKLPGDQAGYTACLFAANGILLALRARHATGKGQYLDISIMECVAATLDHVLVRYACRGEVAARRGSLYWNSAFRIFSCRDGYILLTLFHQWETLVELLAAEGMAGDLTEARWQDRTYRLKHLDHVIRVLERWTKGHSVAELVEQGQLMHFPWAPVNSMADVRNSPQLTGRGFFVDVTCGGKKGKVPGPPFRLKL